MSSAVVCLKVIRLWNENSYLSYYKVRGRNTLNWHINRNSS